MLFANAADGSADIPWIANDFAYRFRLYGDAQRQRLLGSVTVRRGRPYRALYLDLVFACVAVGAVLSPILAAIAIVQEGVLWSRRLVRRRNSASVPGR